MLVVIGGLPGVGKTTVARAVAGRLLAIHLRVDAFEVALVRQGLVAAQSDVGPHGYGLALAAADTCLAADTDVVVDAVFDVAAARRPFAELAARHGTPVRWLRLICSDPAEHRRRVEERVADLPGHVVPAWSAVRRRDVDQWHEQHTVVDTARADPLTVVLAALRTPEAAVRAHVDAFDAGDLDALMAGFTPDATWRTGRSDAAGTDELRALFAGALAGLSPRLTLRTLTARGDTVAAELTETLMVDGETRHVPISGWYQVRNGRIAQAHIYREGSAEIS
ncbi:Predicted kinase [Modestobacter sp. DSM 44400]|uniref:nuclear transport factor 2 family protein n=1 Tax=Modestobacter sp. DSM 44400 TaxID=1550230 RepID=UPI00089B6A41|nr:nuclear transport factor 2 family protein [Modestobacter sp. DSM 44400]SDX78602.1 Predicted kinase [Modestobacter sp. DSM 44400]